MTITLRDWLEEEETRKSQKTEIFQIRTNEGNKSWGLDQHERRTRAYYDGSQICKCECVCIGLIQHNMELDVIWDSKMMSSNKDELKYPHLTVFPSVSRPPVNRITEKSV